MSGTEQITTSINAGAEKAAHVVGEKAAVATIGAGAIAGGVGLAAVLSAALSQMEYEGKRRSLKNLLRDELAALTGKSKKKVRDGDIEVLAQDNHIVAEHLGKVKRERNIGIGVIFAATMLTVGVVLALAFPPTTFISLGLSGGAASVATFLTNAAIAAITYGVVKTPLEKIAHKFFDAEKKSILEKISSIQKDHEDGKTITAERVFSIFVQANPDLASFIENKYGNKFKELSVADKQALTETIGTKLDVVKITDDINHSRVKATELVFAVEGKISGVLPKAGEEPKHTVLMTIKEKLQHVGDSFHHNVNDAPEKSFVERTVRVPRSQVGYVKSLEDARAQESLIQQR